MIRTELQTTSRLQSIRRPKTMPGTDYRCQLNHISGQLHPCQIRPSEDLSNEANVAFSLAFIGPTLHSNHVSRLIAAPEPGYFFATAISSLRTLLSKRLFALNQVD